MTSPADPVPGHVAATLDQFASLTSGGSTWTTAGLPGLIPELRLADGPHGLRVPGRAGLLGASAPATCFPPAACLGSSWDPELAAEVGAAIGAEARAQPYGHARSGPACRPAANHTERHVP